MKQQDMTVVAVRIPPDVLEELDLAAKHLNRKRGPAALELLKVGLRYYRTEQPTPSFPPVPRPTLNSHRTLNVGPAIARSGDNIVGDRLKKLEERLAKLEKKGGTK